MDDEKLCKHCGSIKPLSFFYYRNDTKRYYAICKSCDIQIRHDNRIKKKLIHANKIVDELKKQFGRHGFTCKSAGIQKQAIRSLYITGRIDKHRKSKSCCYTFRINDDPSYSRDKEHDGWLTAVMSLKSQKEALKRANQKF